MKETLTYNLNTLWISSRIAGGWKLKWLRLGWGSAAAADEGISPRISRALRELCMNYLRFPNCSRLRNPDSRFPNTNPVRPADAIDAVPLLQAKQTQLFSNNPCSTHKSQTNSCRPDTEWTWNLQQTSHFGLCSLWCCTHISRRKILCLTRICGLLQL